MNKSFNLFKKIFPISLYFSFFFTWSALEGAESSVLSIKKIEIDDLNENQEKNIPGGLKNLQKALSSFSDKPITKENISLIKKEIIKYFREHGRPFIIVQIPEQDISNGILKFIIIESKIGEIVYKGNRWFSNEHLKHRLEIETNEVIDENTLLNRLSFLNRNPFHHTNIVFSPGTKESTTDVELVTKDRFPLRVYAGGDNTGTKFTGNNRWFTGFNWGNVFGFGDTLSYQFTADPEVHKFKSNFVNYTSFLPWLHVLNIYGGYALINPNIKDFKSTGKSSQGSLRYNIPIKPLYKALLHEVALGFDLKSTNNNLEFEEEEEVAVITKMVNISQLMFGYTFGGVFSKHELSFDLKFFGAPGALFAHQTNADFNNLRPKAKNRYLYGRLSLEDIYHLPARFSIAAFLRSQGSTGALLPSEQFGLGGYDTVRGYNERDFNADNALCFNFEVRSPGIPILYGKKKIKNELMFLGFVDYGFGYNYHALENEKSTQFLLGVGPGLRFNINPYLSLRLDYGFQLHHIQFAEDRFGKLHLGIMASY